MFFLFKHALHAHETSDQLVENEEAKTEAAENKLATHIIIMTCVT